MDAVTLKTARPQTRTRSLRAGGKPCARARILRASLWRCLLLLVALVGGETLLPTRVASAEISTPRPARTEPIAVTADRATHWQQGDCEVWVLWGNCEIKQHGKRATAQQAVLWIDHASVFSRDPHRVIAYMEGEVVINYAPMEESPAAKEELETWLGHFVSTEAIEVRVPSPEQPPAEMPEIYRRAIVARTAPYVVLQAQFIQSEPVPAPAGRPAGRRLHVERRSNTPFQIETVQGSRQDETVGVISGGVNIVVEGLDTLGKVEIETDRMVVWAGGADLMGMLGGAAQQEETPIEFYMEGNIIFRQGDRVIYAEAMYYNVNQEFGVVLDAEMLTPVPEYQGLLRLKADVLQQFNRQHFQATGAAVTSSRIGVPRYWFQAETVEFQDVQMQLTNPFTGAPEIDPITGQPVIEHELLATSRDNLVYMGGVPVFYWPTMATDLTKPNYYLDNIRIGSDRIFGFQIMTDWDMHQLLGIEDPLDGTEWIGSVDYLSKRGPALGTTYNYDRYGSFGLPGGIVGPYHGRLDAWGIWDNGLDTLDFLRKDMVPEGGNPRGRVLWQHQHLLPDGYQITGQFGLISDRNFLEEYFEEEWDTFKDELTALEIKRIYGNQSWAINGQVRLNDFFMQTEQLPRFDHFLLGQSLLGDSLTWNAHSNVGYLHQTVATTPVSPKDVPWTPLPWEVDVEGARAATRHELALPVSAGPVEVVPYVLGELAYWGADINNEEISRAYGQVGVRASLPMWRADHNVCSTLWNLRGLAHKVSFDVDMFYADSSQDISRFTLYDPLGDDAQEHFRRRIVVQTFGGVLPPQFDSRSFGIRDNTQGWVTGPTEIADDMLQAQFGVRQRWQTYRGLPGNERIVDWITFDVQGTFFPDASRDNFGSYFGMFDYDFRWHVGDRVSILSDGYFDTFSQGLRTASIGALASRPGVANLYMGLRSIEGPLSSTIASTYLTYRMNDKWIGAAGMSLDLGPAGNLGQSLELTRIGESFLITVGMTIDEGRDNVGFRFGLEPRFLASGRRGIIGGERIAPAGMFGLE